MGFWTAIVLIVLITSIAGVFGHRSHRKDEAIPEQERRTLEGERDAARAELEDLRERVKVLERIATDPSRRTAEEIEKLRDE